MTKLEISDQVSVHERSNFVIAKYGNETCDFTGVKYYGTPSSVSMKSYGTYCTCAQVGLECRRGRQRDLESTGPSLLDPDISSNAAHSHSTANPIVHLTQVPAYAQRTLGVHYIPQHFMPVELGVP